MGNCLVTKLKAVVDNDNLKKLGVLDLVVDAANLGNTAFFTTSASAENGFSLIPQDGKLIWDSNDQSYTEYQMTAGSENVQLLFKSQGTENYKVSIKEKYYVKSLKLPNVAATVDLDDLYGCNFTEFSVKPGYGKGSLSAFKNMNYLNFLYLSDNDRVYGDINVFANKGSLERLFIGGCSNVVGNIVSLGGCTNLVTFDFHDSGVNGSIEDFVSAQIAAGRTSTTTPINATQALQYLTFGGTKHEERIWTHYIEWTSANKINVYCSNNTLENFTKVYAKGATAEEIAAWEQAGKTVVIVS